MNKKGFTLIELLIVVVIIGILAAIAIPRFGETRERAFVSTMSSDLRNLQTVQEQYYFEGYTYASDLSALDFDPSDGVNFAWSNTTANTYTVTATHDALDANTTCVLNVGVANTPDGVTC